MTRLRNMKIRTKMLVSFMLVIALVVMVVAIGTRQMDRIRNSYNIVIKHPIALEMELREFQSEYRDIRRIVATMAMLTSDELAARESLFDEAGAAHDLAATHIEQAKTIIAANPELTASDKDVRLASTDRLAAAFAQYHEEVTLPLISAVRANDHDEALRISGHASMLAREVLEKIDVIIALATEAADKQVRKAEDEAKSTIVLMLVISLFAVLISVAIALFMSNYIGKSLAPITEFMRLAATGGDIHIRPEWVDVINRVGRNKDELGQITIAAAAFFGRVADIGRVLESISAGDLTSELPLLSDRDTMGLAFRNMQDNLNAMCGDINESSQQVAAGASQVTAGAQALSSGSTEQAASIEELSDAIAQITERTKQTAGLAGQASRLAGDIKDNAETSRLRMEEMLAVSRLICEASEAIRKIIRTIDEIAFQTNILAVNASVEAAHAGRYGKGFSVVAAAVRRLALKSAEAAKDTESLIANSMEKAGLGVGIAEEASSSLEAIVSGINENSRLLATIAKSSEEQSFTIEQINVGIGQVSQVVRLNSVTAEESAAASEEMCAQAAILQSLTSRFILK